MKVINEGIQVEWQESEDFMAWMLMMEQAAVQTDIQVKPHICDTAILYRQFGRSPLVVAALIKEFGQQGDFEASLVGPGAKLVEGMFAANFKGKAIHRMTDAKRMLKNSEPAVLENLCAWRKKVSFVHANAFPQAYVLCDAWAGLKGNLLLCSPQVSSQQAVLQQAQRLVEQAQINWDAEVPKITRVDLTLAIFRKMCQSIHLCNDYYK
eukprot:1237996-Lingulodinium_polyedra.AAC.1